MQSLSKYNKGNKYLLCAIDLFSKYVWVVPLKIKEGLVLLMHFKKYSQKEKNQIKHGFIKVVNFCNNSFKDFLKINNIEMYSTYNEGKPVVAERVIRTQKNKILSK